EVHFCRAGDGRRTSRRTARACRPVRPKSIAIVGAAEIKEPLHPRSKHMRVCLWTTGMGAGTHRIVHIAFAKIFFIGESGWTLRTRVLVSAPSTIDTGRRIWPRCDRADVD